MRNLATIQRITEVKPIPNADAIECVKVLGWQCVVKKSDGFKVGDSVVYVEVDSIMPDKPEYAFLRDSKGTIKRLRTIKLRGQISQGLVLPLSVLPTNFTFTVGTDVTEILGVTKWEQEVPASLRGKQKSIKTIQFPKWMPEWARKIMGKYLLRISQALWNKPTGASFPPWIPKTDETRVQVLQSMLEVHKGTPVYWSEKLDGCLHYSTFVETDKGQIQIGRIVNQKLDVKILTYNEYNQKMEYKDIEHYHKYETLDKKFLNIGVAFRGHGNRPKFITCTDNHHFLTKSGWVEAKDLKIGDIVYHLRSLLQPEAEQLILGSLLGDSSIIFRGESRAVASGHSIAQEDYLKYKMSILGKLALQQKGQVGGFPGSKENVRFITAGSVSITNLIKNYCEVNSQKTVTKQWADKLTPIGLAFWYMDDGSIQHRDEKKQRPKAILFTNSYSLPEVSILKEMLLNKYGIASEIRTKDCYKGNVLDLSSDGSAVFYSLIAPYVCESMKYKLPLKYMDMPCVFDNFVCTDVDGLAETVVLSKTEGLNEGDVPYGKYVYDLTVKDNHNYFAGRILVHNSSITIYLKDGDFGVCSRNIDLKEESGNAFWDTVRKLHIEEKLKRVSKLFGTPNVAIQGELIGPGIQGNKYKLVEKDIYFFNVYDINNMEYLGYEEAFEFIEDYMEEKFVPVVYHEDLVPSSDYYVESAKGKSVLADVMREGIVIRPVDNLTDFEQRGLQAGRVSFKAINQEFLLKFEDN